ncbi:MAG: hypothetical protein KDA54_12970, partial [Phycisphaerales bacterium]|nr:hypothetical protein [Phycisphaerales bacterium]
GTIPRLDEAQLIIGSPMFENMGHPSLAMYDVVRTTDFSDLNPSVAFCSSTLHSTGASTHVD